MRKPNELEQLRFENYHLERALEQEREAVARPADYSDRARGVIHRLIAMMPAKKRDEAFRIALPILKVFPEQLTGDPAIRAYLLDKKLGRLDE